MRSRVSGALVVVAVLVVAGMAACRNAATEDPAPMTLRVTSPEIPDGAMIPKQFTCDGAGVSPALDWEQPPAKTASLVVIVSDPDAPGGTFIHWVVYDLPAGTRGVAQGAVPNGSRQGVNSSNAAGYYGPCPPGGAPHRYFFRVYALDQMLALPDGANEEQVSKAMRGHVLAAGRLMGRYGRR